MKSLNSFWVGLSKTSALALAELMAADSLTEEEYAARLADSAWEDLELPALVKREIRTALRFH